MNKTIYMTYKNHNFPKEKVFQRWKKLNPDWNIEFSDDVDCKRFIRQHFGKKYEDLFDHIKSGPNKADLWRLCKLYLFGGLYADIDIIPYKPIEYIIKDSDFCTCLSMDKKSIFQAFLFVKEKNNPIIKKCILSLLENKHNYHWEKNEPTTDMYNNISEMIEKDIISGVYESKISISKELYDKHFICESNFIYKDKNKIKILEEYAESIINWQDCKVRFNGVDVMKSRDLDYLESKINSTIWNQEEYIPKIIYKTGPFKYENLPEEVKGFFVDTLKLNPGFEMVYFDDKQCEEFVKKNFNSKILNAYNSLVPSAYKADMFRYCLLYKNGGIWSDFTQKFYEPMNNFIDFKKDKLILVEGGFIDIANKKGIEIAFMASSPKKEIFMKAINEIVLNVESNYYGHSSFCPTGPIMFRKLVDSNSIVYKKGFEFKRVNINSGLDYEDYIIYENKKILKTRCLNHGKYLYLNENKPHYSELYANKKIYKNDTKKNLPNT